MVALCFFGFGMIISPYVERLIRFLMAVLTPFWFWSFLLIVCSSVIALLCYFIGNNKDSEADRKEKSFEVRHKKLYLCVGCSLTIVLCVIVLMLLKVISYIIGNFLTWIGTVSSKLDAVIIVALITGIVSILSAVISKYLEYRRAREEYLAKKREEPYGEFIDMVYKLQKNIKTPGSYTEDMMTADILRFSQKITLWGSPKVVEKWNQFRENGADPNNSVNNLFLIEEIMNEMRKDIGLKKTKKGKLLGFFINDVDKYVKK